MGAISDFPINSALFALKSAVLAKLNKLLSNEDKNVTGGYSVTSSDVFKTLHISGTAATITIPLSAISDGQWINFTNTTGNTYTFAVSGGLTLQVEGGTKDKSATQNTSVTAYRKGTNLFIIGKLSA